ncbi:unnamed protein product [Chrysoparadoxa australica]
MPTTRSGPIVFCSAPVSLVQAQLKSRSLHVSIAKFDLEKQRFSVRTKAVEAWRDLEWPDLEAARVVRAWEALHPLLAIRCLQLLLEDPNKPSKQFHVTLRPGDPAKLLELKEHTKGELGLPEHEANASTPHIALVNEGRGVTIQQVDDSVRVCPYGPRGAGLTSVLEEYKGVGQLFVGDFLGNGRDQVVLLPAAGEDGADALRALVKLSVVIDCLCRWAGGSVHSAMGNTDGAVMDVRELARSDKPKKKPSTSSVEGQLGRVAQALRDRLHEEQGRLDAARKVCSDKKALLESSRDALLGKPTSDRFMEGLVPCLGDSGTSTSASPPKPRAPAPPASSAPPELATRLETVYDPQADVLHVKVVATKGPGEAALAVSLSACSPVGELTGSCIPCSRIEEGASATVMAEYRLGPHLIDTRDGSLRVNIHCTWRGQQGVPKSASIGQVVLKASEFLGRSRSTAELPCSLPHEIELLVEGTGLDIKTAKLPQGLMEVKESRLGTAEVTITSRDVANACPALHALAAALPDAATVAPNWSSSKALALLQECAELLHSEATGAGEQPLTDRKMAEMYRLGLGLGY